MTDKNKETGEYIKGLADEINNLNKELKYITDKLLKANGGESDGAIGEAVKEIYGISGVIDYITNYMEVDSKSFKYGTFFNQG